MAVWLAIVIFENLSPCVGHLLWALVNEMGHKEVQTMFFEIGFALRFVPSVHGMILWHVSKNLARRRDCRATYKFSIQKHGPI